MVVNSFIFWAFFAIVLLLYFSAFKNTAKGQNFWLLLTSYFFYGWVDWKMIPFLLIVTIVFYGLGKQIHKNNRKNPRLSSLLTTIGVILGVGILVYFKYLDFMVEEVCNLLSSIGLTTNFCTISIIMPIGISFFTFKLISYLIEIHRENMEAANDFVPFGAYIAFFPTILSGPIDRPQKFLPQLQTVRKFDINGVSEGLKRVVWGMFTKMCIADILVSYTDAVLNNYSHHNATTIIAAMVMYAIQMYADFCGYSNMAIGTARIMGFEVAENFNRPFFAQNLAEHWRRWHMSLTSWLTDYVFMPLNLRYRDYGKWGLYLATIVNLVLVGAWHGANWTYVVFGLYHGLLLIAIMENDKRRKKFEKKHLLKKKEWYIWSRRLLCFVMWCIGQMIFRSESMSSFWSTMAQIGKGFGMINLLDPNVFAFGLLSVVLLFVKDYLDEYKSRFHFMYSSNVYIRIVSISIIISYIILCGALEGKTFIYFQF